MSKQALVAQVTNKLGHNIPTESGATLSYLSRSTKNIFAMYCAGNTILTNLIT